MQINSFIANEFYQSNSQFIKYNPYTLDVLHQVNSCDLLGLIGAIQSANRAFTEWKSVSFADRITLVEKIKNLLISKADEWAELEALDQALPLHFVKQNSLALSVQNIQQLLGESPEPDLHFSPVGVVAIVAPWNLSLRVILDRLIPCLLAGNAAVVKVSSQSPVSAHILSEIFKTLGAPAGLVNVIVSDDVEVKKTLIAHPGVKAVSFAGSIETTAAILPILSQSSLQSFKKIQVSSGSKNSAVVLTEPSDSNFESIMDSFVLGQGQLVWNSSRLFILEKFEQEWQERLRVYLDDLKPSESIYDKSAWGPCLKKNSFLKFDEIKRTAFADQAKILQAAYSLSEKQKTCYLPPVFTQDMSRCSTLQQDQIHAPFYILSSVKYPFDVAKYSNVSYFGFAAHLWGERDKLSKVAEALDVGLVSYNKSSVEQSGAVSAVKQSGFGLQDFRFFGAFYSNVKKMS